jgi:hypothetical protein
LRGPRTWGSDHLHHPSPRRGSSRRRQRPGSERRRHGAGGPRRGFRRDQLVTAMVGKTLGDVQRPRASRSRADGRPLEVRGRGVMPRSPGSISSVGAGEVVGSTARSAQAAWRSARSLASAS